MKMFCWQRCQEYTDMQQFSTLFIVRNLVHDIEYLKVENHVICQMSVNGYLRNLNTTLYTRFRNAHSLH